MASCAHITPRVCAQGAFWSALSEELHSRHVPQRAIERLRSIVLDVQRAPARSTPGLGDLLRRSAVECARLAGVDSGTQVCPHPASLGFGTDVDGLRRAGVMIIHHYPTRNRQGNAPVNLWARTGSAGARP